MQPLYVQVRAGGATVATPREKPRVTHAAVWVNSAMGTLANVEVHCDGEGAREQGWAGCEVRVPEDVTVEWDPERRILSIDRERSVATERKEESR